MERLSTLDAEFLHLEDGVGHLHIAGVCTFDDPPPSIEEFSGLIASKLNLIPRYRQRVRGVPFDLGRPVWVDDPHFRLDYHVRHTALPSPGGDAELCSLMGRLMSQPLDRNRPLWEAWLVEGLDDDRWAIVFKVHHCMVDGIAGVGLLTVLLDLEPDAALPEPEPWEPEPEPPGLFKVVDAWQGAMGDAAGWVRRAPDAVHDPVGAARRAGELGAGLVRFGLRLGMTPSSSIEGAIGPHRIWRHSSAELPTVKAIGRDLGGTVNDVVLAAVSSGFRRLLIERGEDPADTVVRSMVPVSVRSVGATSEVANHVSTLIADLPVGVEDPIERFEAIRDRMQQLKASHMAEAGELVTELANLAPPPLVSMVSRLGVRAQHLGTQRSVTTVTTNVPGPQFPLYCLGREMRSYLPFVPISHGVRIGTAILSYNGHLAFGVTGDLDTVPDAGVLADSIALGVDELDQLRQS